MTLPRNQDALLADRPRTALVAEPKYGNGDGLVDLNGRPLASALGFRMMRPSVVKVQTLVQAELDRREAKRIADIIESRSADPRPFAERMILDLDQLFAMPDPPALIEDWLDLGTDAGVTGQSGAYKSFVALDMSCCIAMGQDWHGRQVKQADVLYVIGEGFARFKWRISAWCEHNDVDLAELKRHLWVTPSAVQIDGPDWDALTEWVVDNRVGLVTIDTKARATVEYEENSNSDQTRVHEHLLGMCRKANGNLTTLLVQHTGHANGDAADRQRGASSGRGAHDAEFLLRKVGEFDAVLRNDKQKDRKGGEVVGVRMVEVAGSLAVDIAEVLPPSPRQQWVSAQVAKGVKFNSARDLQREARSAGIGLDNNQKQAAWDEYNDLLRVRQAETWDPNMINRDPFAGGS